MMAECDHTCSTALWVIILLLFCTCGVCDNESDVKKLEYRIEQLEEGVPQ